MLAVRTAVALLLALGSAVSTARPAAQSRLDARITGRVVSADGIPLLRARIVVSRAGRAWAPIFVDESGAFELPRIETPFTIRITKAGYAPEEISRPRPGQPLTVAMTRAAVVRGQVVDAAGEPVVGAAVRIRRLETPGAAATAAVVDTDDRGEFRLGNLPQGRYELRAYDDPALSHPDEVTPAMAAVMRAERLLRTAALSAPAVVDARAGEDVSVSLVQARPAVALPYSGVGGVVTGTLLDEFGEPAEGTTVRLWMTRVIDGRQVLAPTGRSRGVDDLGRYRLFHVPAGPYFVVASPEAEPAADGAQPEQFLPVYYPGEFVVTGARSVQIDRARETAGIDIVVPRSRGARVHGVALSADGRPLRGRVALALSQAAAAPGTAINVRPSGLTPLTLSASPRPDGTFEIPRVPPGLYVIQAEALATSPLDALITIDGIRQPLDLTHIDAIREFSMQRLAVTDGDVGPITLTTIPTATITGRIAIDGPRQLITPADFFFKAVNVDPDEAPIARGQTIPDVQLDVDGSFRIDGLIGRCLIVLNRAPAGWWLKSIEIGSVNAATQPVDFSGPTDSRDNVIIELSPTGATLAGRIADRETAGSPSIVVFPTDRRLWVAGPRHVRTTAPGQDGEFELNSFPPGDYFVVAVDDEDSEAIGRWETPEALDSLAPLAQRVTVGERETRQVELRLTRPPR